MLSQQLPVLATDSLISAWQQAAQALQAEKVHGSHWVGQLSTSALSTATAISAWSMLRQRNAELYRSQQKTIDDAITTASQWLIDEQNPDGGFGDTDLSHSNIATTLLVLAAWQLADFGDRAHQSIARGWQYCERVGKWDALRRRYGKDKTFVAPILMNCALAGIVAWDEVPTLPFEAAWLPQSWYRLARMPVVSYAVPALVAIGQAKFYHRPLKGPWGSVRRRAIAPTLRVLQRMQPTSGGYLEAAPLTSFVLMCLADMQLGDHPVARLAVEFLLNSRLADGSLPIDTNLATWSTSLAVSALSYGRTSPLLSSDRPKAAMHPMHSETTSNAANASLEITAEQATPRPSDQPLNVIIASSKVSATTMRWLLSCQHWSPHPFTGAKPGGWGWSNLSGAVPDADDTPAALLALARWTEEPANRQPLLEAQIAQAVPQGLVWLLSLQNRDGGWPTFCRGWGKLPFDRSGSDLTAHALRAITTWQQRAAAGQFSLPNDLLSKIPVASSRGFRFLEKSQKPDGSWFPLWFGNQDRQDEENPVYGTSKVLMAYAAFERFDSVCERGLQWLVENQNSDGGWGGGISVPYRAGKGLPTEVGSSVEETGLALESLLACGASTITLKPTIMRGLTWLVSAVEQNHCGTSWPIGFYFAKLWYHERLYPILAATAALGSAVDHPDLWQASP